MAVKPDPGWSVFGRRVCEALEQCGLSLNAAAQELGIARNTLVSWLKKGSAPDLRKLSDIARLTGLNELVLLESLGALPAGLGSVPAAVHGADLLRAALEEARVWVDQALDSAQLDPIAAVVGALLRKGEARYQVTIRPAMRGRRHPRLMHHYLGLEPLPGPTQSAAGHREELELAMRGAWQTYGVAWRVQKAHDWPRHPSLLLQVPHQERPRRASIAALKAVPHILVLGCPYAHAEFLASLLAQALGYAYEDLRYGLHLPDTSAAPEVKHAAKLNLVRRMLARPARQTVWAIADHEVLADLLQAPEVFDQVPVVLVMGAGPLLRERGAEVWSTSAVELERLQRAMTAMVSESRDDAGHLVRSMVPLDDRRIVEDGAVNRDLLTDEVTDQAAHVLRQLGKLQLVPAQPRAAWLGRMGV